MSQHNCMTYVIIKDELAAYFAFNVPSVTQMQSSSPVYYIVHCI